MSTTLIPIPVFILISDILFFLFDNILAAQECNEEVAAIDEKYQQGGQNNWLCHAVSTKDFKDKNSKFKSEYWVQASDNKRKQEENTWLYEKGSGDVLFFYTDFSQDRISSDIVNTFGKLFKCKKSTAGDKKYYTYIEAEECAYRT